MEDLLVDKLEFLLLVIQSFGRCGENFSCSSDHQRFFLCLPPQTIGCTIGVKHTTYGSPSSSSSSMKGDAEKDFFIELWDMSGHEQYKDCRTLFYSQINGVIFVHDLSLKRTKTSLQKWAAEIVATGSFLAHLGSGGLGGLPVPYIVIGNKADIAAKKVTRGSSGNLVDVARQWVEKQGLLPSNEELPLIESFPGSGGLIAAKYVVPNEDKEWVFHIVKDSWMGYKSRLKKRFWETITCEEKLDNHSTNVLIDHFVALLDY